MKEILGFLVSALILISCSGPETKAPNVFRYNEVSALSSLDPVYARNQSMIWVVNQVFDGLVRLDENLEVQPGLAKSWRISEDGTRYTFTLRKGVYFHRSEHFGQAGRREVVAEDVAYSLGRLLDADLASPGAWVMEPVDYFLAENDSTFTVQLKNPFPPFLGMLSMGYCAVVPFEAAEAGDFGRNPIGTGPFQFKFWKEGVRLILRRNPDYFMEGEGQKLPYLNGVAIGFVPDKQSAFLDYLTGNIDFISGLDASYKDELLSPEGELRARYAEDHKMMKSPYLNTEYLGFAMESIPEGMDSTAYRLVRKAVNHGFDRVAMMRYLRNGIGIPAEAGFVPPGLPKADAQIVADYNPKLVQHLLAEAGFPEGEGLPELDLFTNASYLDLCEYIQSSLAEHGIQMNVEVVPPSTLREMMSTGKASTFRGSWIADYPDAENYLALFKTSNRAPAGPNYSRYSNSSYDALYAQALSTNSDSLRKEIYGQMDSILISDAPVIPLYYDEAVRFTRKEIKGLEPNPLNLLDLRRVKKISE